MVTASKKSHDAMQETWVMSGGVSSPAPISVRRQALLDRRHGFAVRMTGQLYTTAMLDTGAAIEDIVATAAGPGRRMDGKQAP